MGRRLGAYPYNADASGDGLTVVEEVFIVTDPTLADTDGDSIDDASTGGQASVYAGFGLPLAL